MTSKRRILLVDDDADLLRLISLRLKANGFDVNAVSSAQGALARLPVYRPHVLVTDLRMPGMDGMEVFEVVQQRNLRLPVIVLTAHGTIPDALAAPEKGVLSYLVKPFDAQVLLAHIEKALQQSGEADAADVDGSHQEWRSRIISHSQVMESLLQQTKAAAVTHVSVLIQS